MQQIHNDEIDVFEIFQKLWDGKWLISAFTILSMLIGASIIFFKEPAYESKITLYFHNIPPAIDANSALVDFEEKFYSKSTFEAWKKNIGKTSLIFDKFSNIKVVDGHDMSKPEVNQLATIITNKKNGSYILIKSNEFSILEGFFKYSNFINELLKIEYVDRAQNEIKTIEKLYNNNDALTNVIPNILSLERFIINVENGRNVFIIKPPTIPKDLSAKNNTSTIVLYLLLGVFIGVFYVLISKAIINHRADG